VFFRKLTVTLAVIAVSCGALWKLGDGIAYAAQRVVRQATFLDSAGRRILAGADVATAYGEDPGLFWIDLNAGAARVHAAVPVGAPAVELGPAGTGEDTALRAAADHNGRLWVAATRRDADGDRLWVQRGTSRGWEPPLFVPGARGSVSRPAIAAGTEELWVVWIVAAGDTNRGQAQLLAQRLGPSGWGPVESVPVVGAPTQPSIAVDASRDSLTAVWAANDGVDAEIWTGDRREGSWTPARPLTSNQVPDLFPSIAAQNGRTLVAWSTYADSKYLPVARLRDADDVWAAMEILSTEPGLRLRALGGGGSFAITWSTPALTDAGDTTLIRGAVLDRGRWQAPVTLGETATVWHASAADADGATILVWGGAKSSLEIVEAPPGDDRDRRSPGIRLPTARGEGDIPRPQPLSVFRGAADQQGLPRVYTAFGDSITQGILIEDGLNVETEGYLPRLAANLGTLIADPVVLKRAVGGETTADGLSRFEDTLRATDPEVVLVMEGTNDAFFGVDPDATAFNLRRMLELARARGVTPYLSLIMPRSESLETSINLLIQDINTRLPQVAQDNATVTVDQFTPFLDQPDLYSNVNHPNQDGYGLMGDTWFDGIRPLLLAVTNRGDVDASGRVDGIDLVLLALAFGREQGEEGYRAEADVNSDGIVDGFDLAILIEFFGQQL
jgi:acyl-CoA thioesterase-1